MSQKCNICNKELNTDDPLSEDCGGDCLECMADAGDPDAIKSVNKIKSSRKI